MTRSESIRFLFRSVFGEKMEAGNSLRLHSLQVVQYSSMSVNVVLGVVDIELARRRNQPFVLDDFL